jgi:hypothetical protein
MKVRTAAALFVSHALVLGAGFALGVYFLPILIAPPPPPAAEVRAQRRPRRTRANSNATWATATRCTGAKAPCP